MGASLESGILYAWRKLQDAKKARLAGLFDSFAFRRAN